MTRITGCFRTYIAVAFFPLFFLFLGIFWALNKVVVFVVIIILVIIIITIITKIIPAVSHLSFPFTLLHTTQSLLAPPFPFLAPPFLHPPPLPP